MPKGVYDRAEMRKRREARKVEAERVAAEKALADKAAAEKVTIERRVASRVHKVFQDVIDLVSNHSYRGKDNVTPADTVLTLPGFAKAFPLIYAIVAILPPDIRKGKVIRSGSCRGYGKHEGAKSRLIDMVVKAALADDGVKPEPDLGAEDATIQYVPTSITQSEVRGLQKKIQLILAQANSKLTFEQIHAKAGVYDSKKVSQALQRLSSKGRVGRNLLTGKGTRGTTYLYFSPQLEAA